jgi:hypothetical protein
MESPGIMQMHVMQRQIAELVDTKAINLIIMNLIIKCIKATWPIELMRLKFDPTWLHGVTLSNSATISKSMANVGIARQRTFML